MGLIHKIYIFIFSTKAYTIQYTHKFDLEETQDHKFSVILALAKSFTLFFLGVFR